MKCNIKLDTFLFYTAYSLIFLGDFVERTQLVERYGISNFRNVFSIIALYFFLIHICLYFTNVSRHQMCKTFLFTALILISFIFSNFQFTFAMFLCCILCVRWVNLRNLISYDFTIRFCAVVTIILLSLIGVLDKEMIVQNRTILGFNTPNTLGLYFLDLFLEFVYLKSEISNISWSHICFFILFSYVSIKLNISRTMVLCVGLTIILIVLAKIFPKLLMNEFTTYVPIIISIISLFIFVNYDNHNEFLFKLNSMLTGRIYLGNLYYQKYGFSLLGQKIIHTFAFDSGYIRLAIQYGLSIMFLFVILYRKLLVFCVKKKDLLLLICSIIFVIYGFSEFHVCYVTTNFTLLYIGKVFWNTNVELTAVDSSNQELIEIDPDLNEIE